jgi:hypothetical protein
MELLHGVSLLLNWPDYHLSICESEGVGQSEVLLLILSFSHLCDDLVHRGHNHPWRFFRNAMIAALNDDLFPIAKEQPPDIA